MVSREFAAAERTALTYALWAAVLIIVGGVLSLAADFETTTANGVVHLGTPFLAVSLATGACEFIVVGFFFLAFRNLTPQDQRFSTPSKLALVLLVAIVIVVAALVPLISAANSLETCLNNAGTDQTAQSGCISAGSLIALLGVGLVAGILALVGYVGVLIGVWRLGNRYQNRYLKVGAILLIIPLLNIVGGVLILGAVRAARDARKPATGA